VRLPTLTLLRESVASLVSFFCARLQDYHCTSEVLLGLHALVEFHPLDGVEEPLTITKRYLRFVWLCRYRDWMDRFVCWIEESNASLTRSFDHAGFDDGSLYHRNEPHDDGDDGDDGGIRDCTVSLMRFKYRCCHGTRANASSRCCIRSSRSIPIVRADAAQTPSTIETPSSFYISQNLSPTSPNADPMRGSIVIGFANSSMRA